MKRGLDRSYGNQSKEQKTVPPETNFMNMQINYLRDSAKAESKENDLVNNFTFLYHLVKNNMGNDFHKFHSSFHKTIDEIKISATSSSIHSSWCRSVHPNKALLQNLKACRYIPLDRFYQKSPKSSHSLDLKNCYFCPEHCTFHVCSNYSFNESIFIETPVGSTMRKSLLLGSSSYQQIKMNNTNSLSSSSSTVTLVFGSCKFIQGLDPGLANHNDREPDQDYCICAIGKNQYTTSYNLIIKSLNQSSNQTIMNNNSNRQTPKLSSYINVMDYLANNLGNTEALKSNINKKITTIPKTIEPVMSDSLVSKSSLLSYRLLNEIDKSDNPMNSFQVLLASLNNQTKKTNSTFKQIDIAVLSSMLTPQKRKSLNRQKCFKQVSDILIKLFFSNQRTVYHNSIKEKKIIEATNAVRKYHSRQIMSNQETPLGIVSLMLFLSHLTILPSQSPALPFSKSLIDDISEQIYRHWIVICLSPESLLGGSAIDFTSIVLAILFSMRRGGRSWGSQTIIHGNEFVKKHLCSSTELEEFGFKKKQHTRGNNVINITYQSLMLNKIPIPTFLLGR